MPCCRLLNDKLLRLWLCLSCRWIVGNRRVPRWNRWTHRVGLRLLLLMRWYWWIEALLLQRRCIKHDSEGDGCRPDGNCQGYNIQYRYKTSVKLCKQVLPKSFGKSASLLPRWRMHSPTACASCTMCNVTNLLWNVTEASLKRYGTLQKLYRSVADRYGTLQNRYGKYRFCPSLIQF